MLGLKKAEETFGFSGSSSIKTQIIYFKCAEFIIRLLHFNKTTF